MAPSFECPQYYSVTVAVVYQGFESCFENQKKKGLKKVYFPLLRPNFMVLAPLAPHTVW